MNSTDFLLWLEGLRNPALDALFALATFLGSPEFALMVLPLIYWCLNRTVGLQVAWVLLGSAYLNEGLKNVFMEPRPGPPLHPMYQDTAPGYSWPSGHAMNAAALWLTLAGIVRGSRYLIIALVLIFLIGFSRLYFGLHWPIDVISGWIIGGALALLALLLIRAFPNVQAQRFTPLMLAGVALVPVLLVLLVGTVDSAVPTGAAMGMIIGWWLERRYVGFEAAAPLLQQVLKVVIGVVGVLVLRYGLKPVFAAIIPNEVAAEFLRYAIIGLWIAWLAPMIFVRIFGSRPQTVSQPAA